METWLILLADYVSNKHSTENWVRCILTNRISQALVVALPYFISSYQLLLGLGASKLKL